MQPIIRIEGLAKQYRIGARREPYGSFRESLMQAVTYPARRLRGQAPPRQDTIWALKDISFDVAPGEVVGIIGRNGAGKSTLLKVLSRITDPTAGRVELRGRVASLLEVGTGFHPELTGRENVYLNGAILGMTRKEIRRKFDEIIAFAEVEQFLDTPVKHYSSGMYVRLAFAVAAHLEPEILVVDEVLAVGDSAFQKKCLGKMDAVAHAGRTVIFVSHNVSTLLNLCTCGVFIEKGKLKCLGPIRQVAEAYMKQVCASESGFTDLRDHSARKPGCVPLIAGVEFVNARGESSSSFACGETFRVHIHLEPVVAVDNLFLGIGVDDSLGARVFSVTTDYCKSELPALTSRRIITCEIKDLPLVPGNYSLSLCAGRREQSLMDALYNAVSFSVNENDFFGTGHLPRPDLGAVLVRSEWSLLD
jgi:lipopolysaccharide transport system ATP-binding protein